MKNFFKERDVFSKTLYFESGSTQEIFDTIMVGWVIRNRVERKGSLGRWFGNTYTKVCLKKWHFSCWNGKTLKQIDAIDLDGKFRWGVCLAVAEYIMRAPAKDNPLPEIYYYYNPMLVAPSWAKNKKMVMPKLGLDHIFVK